MPSLLSSYIHRYLMTLQSTLTQKIRNVKVREEIPTSPTPYTSCRSTDYIPRSPAPCPFTHLAPVSMGKTSSPGLSMYPPNCPSVWTILFSYLLRKWGREVHPLALRGVKKGFLLANLCQPHFCS